MASDAFAAKLWESKISLGAARAEVASLKEQVARAGTEKADFEKLVDQACERSEQRLVRLNIALVGRTLAEKLTHSLVTDSVNAVDAVLQQ